MSTAPEPSDQPEPEHNPHEPPLTQDSDQAADAEKLIQPVSTSKPHPHAGWAILWAVALAVVQVVVGLAFATVFLIIAIAAGRRPQEIRSEDLIPWLMPVGTLTTLLLALLLVFIFCRRHARANVGWRGMAPQQWLLVVLSILPAVVVSSEVTNWAARVLPTFQLQEMESFIQQSWPLVFVAGCLLPGLGEELYFRGFLSRGLIANHGVVAGTLLASFLFGIVHIDPVQSTGAFFIGITLQYLFLTTKSLLAPIVLHTLNNTIAFALYKAKGDFYMPGLSPPPGDEIVHTPVLVLISALAAAAVMYWMFFQMRTRWMTADGKEWSPGYISGEAPVIEATPVSGFPSIGALSLGVLSYAALIYFLVAAYNNPNAVF